MDEKQGLLGGPQPSAPPPYPGDSAPQAFPASGYPPGYSTPGASAPHYAQPAAPPPSYYSQQPPQGVPPAPSQGQQRTTTVVVHRTPCVRVYRAPPPDYTAYAIIGVICFFPLGLMALTMANRAKESAAAGHMDDAYSAAVSARLMSRLAVSIGSIILTVVILAVVLPLSIY